MFRGAAAGADIFSLKGRMAMRVDWSATALALTLVTHCAAFAPCPLLRTSLGMFGTQLQHASVTPLLQTARYKSKTGRVMLSAEAGGGDAVDENYYSVAAIRGKQAVANPQRGGNVSILEQCKLCVHVQIFSMVC